jgi:hypothetical protein
MKRNDLMMTAEDCRGRLGFPGFSVFSWPDADAHEIAHRVKAIRDRNGTDVLRNGDLRKTTARRIRRAGTNDRHPFSLVKTFGRGHYTLRLPSHVTDDDWNLIDQVFDVPEINPVGWRASYGA